MGYLLGPVKQTIAVIPITAAQTIAVARIPSRPGAVRERIDGTRTADHPHDEECFEDRREEVGGSDRLGLSGLRADRESRRSRPDPDADFCVTT